MRSPLEEGGGAHNRLDIVGRVATALDRHLIVSFPDTVPARLKDAVQAPDPVFASYRGSGSVPESYTHR